MLLVLRVFESTEAACLIDFSTASLTVEATNLTFCKPMLFIFWLLIWKEWKKMNPEELNYKQIFYKPTPTTGPNWNVTTREWPAFKLVTNYLKNTTASVSAIFIKFINELIKRRFFHIYFCLIDFSTPSLTVEATNLKFCQPMFFYILATHLERI